MNIPFDGSLTKEEFKDVIKLANRPVSRKLGSGADAWGVLVFLGVIVIAVALRMLFIENNLNSGVIVAATGAIILVLGLKARAAPDRAWNEYQKTDLRRAGSITDDYLEVRSSTGNSQAFWAGFSGYGEYRNIMILIQGVTVYPFSTRFFRTETDWQEFRKFVSSKLPITYKVQTGFLHSPAWLIWLLFIASAVLMVLLKELK